MVEAEAKRLVTNFLDDLGIGREQAIVTGILVIKRRQHQNPAGAIVHGHTGQRDGVGKGAGPGAGHQGAARNTGLGQPIQNPNAFFEAKRIGLAGSAQNGQPVAAVVQKPAAMSGHQINVRVHVTGYGGKCGGINAGKGKVLLSHCNFLLYRCVIILANRRCGFPDRLYRVQKPPGREPKPRLDAPFPDHRKPAGATKTGPCLRQLAGRRRSMEAS